MLSQAARRQARAWPTCESSAMPGGRRSSSRNDRRPGGGARAHPLQSQAAAREPITGANSETRLSKGKHRPGRRTGSCGGAERTRGTAVSGCGCQVFLQRRRVRRFSISPLQLPRVRGETRFRSLFKPVPTLCVVGRFWQSEPWISTEIHIHQVSKFSLKISRDGFFPCFRRAICNPYFPKRAAVIGGPPRLHMQRRGE